MLFQPLASELLHMFVPIVHCSRVLAKGAVRWNPAIIWVPSLLPLAASEWAGSFSALGMFACPPGWWGLVLSVKSLLKLNSMWSV